MLPYFDLGHRYYSYNLCFTGIHYSLVGGKNPSVGRVELNYDGVVGTVCAWSWKTADAKVLCRQLGYKDGIVNYDINHVLPTTKRWITGFFCQGDEKTLMTCLNTGFNSSFLDDLCMHREPGAYTSCYNDTIGTAPFCFYAPGLKGPPGASSNRIVCPSVRPSVCLSVRNSIPLTNKVQ